MNETIDKLLQSPTRPGAVTIFRVAVNETIDKLLQLTTFLANDVHCLHHLKQSRYGFDEKVMNG